MDNLMSPLKETIYGTDDCHGSTKKVQTLAISIYHELDYLIKKVGEDDISRILPLIVNALEDLDLAYVKLQENEVELELLRDDNDQLVVHLDKEKKQKKAAEQKALELEYNGNEQLQSKVESLESLVRLLEHKCRKATNHSSRLEEREEEQSKELAKLHSRHSELLKKHKDLVERTMMNNDNSENLNSKPRYERYPSHTYSVQEDLPEDSLQDETEDSFTEQVPSAPLETPAGQEIGQGLISPTRLLDPGPVQPGLHSLKTELQMSGWDLDDDYESIVHATTTYSPPKPSSGSPKKTGGGSPEEEPKSALCKEKRGTNTLYQELNFDDITENEIEENSDSLAVADNFFAGVGIEFEQLIQENNELLATKNALNIVKDDLIAKVDELTSEVEISKEEIHSLEAQKEKIKKRMLELEEELKSTKEELAKVTKSDDEEVPMAQRKRFTRVEMARVLMERNQYKERLMELQEAVRWADMIRAASKDSAASGDAKKGRSSIWRFFSSLFSSTDKPDHRVQYNAPSDQVSPALDLARRHRNRSMEFVDSEITSEKIQKQRAKERREQYRQVRAHVRREDGRVQAYGWSLPSAPQPHSVPAPVYCRPLVEKDPGLKIWCAAGINLTGGNTKDGGAMVGASVFYSNPPPQPEQLPPDVSEVDKLERELQERAQRRREQELQEQELSSYVWICASTHGSSVVTVVDANNPGDVLDTFPVCASHLLAIASIPGMKPTDFEVDEEFLNLGQEVTAESQSQSSQPAPAETKISSIKFVSCAAGSAVALEPPPSPPHPPPAQAEGTDEPDGAEEERERFRQWVVVKDPPELVKDGVNAIPRHNPLALSQMEKISSVLPTMWLGAQNGKLYVHSSVAQWFRCIDSVQLPDAILTIVHIRGRVFVSLANGSVAIFHRSSDGQWDLGNYHLLDLGQPNHSIRCMAVVHDKIWCGITNHVHIIDAKTLTVEAGFVAHPRKESQVRLLAWAGDGVWLSLRLDSTLRLFHAHTHQHLQDLDLEPCVTRMLGTGQLGFSFVRITSLLISSSRLWIGTGNGVIISVPLSDKEEEEGQPGDEATTRVRVYSDCKEAVTPGSYIPHVDITKAQLSFHGHRDAVKFFVAVPVEKLMKVDEKNDNKDDIMVISNGSNPFRNHSSKSSSKQSPEPCKYMLVMSGGEGYIDFRLGDGEEEEEEGGEVERKTVPQGLSKGDWSHLIAWQVAVSPTST